jgi:hypothetical protein
LQKEIFDYDPKRGSMVFFIHFDKADLRAAMKGFARIHWQNLCNFGILPLTFADFNLPAKV